MTEKNISIMTMGPICIAKKFQRQGYGKILLDYSLEQAKSLGCGAICIEGNINFYSKSGFKYASEYKIRYHSVTEGEDDTFFLCKELIEGYLKGISGVYKPPEGYFVAEKIQKHLRILILNFHSKKKKFYRDKYFREKLKKFHTIFSIIFRLNYNYYNVNYLSIT